jgi:hypothetical protein
MSGARLVKGRKYRLVRDMHEPDFPVGTVFTYVDSVDYFDWFKCLIEIDVGRTGVRHLRVGYGLDNFCEPLEEP